ncbi:MAG: enoyl-CoA hydratase-related protein [Pseudomonadota bacterium]
MWITPTWSDRVCIVRVRIDRIRIDGVGVYGLGIGGLGIGGLGIGGVGVDGIGIDRAGYSFQTIPPSRWRSVQRRRAGAAGIGGLGAATSDRSEGLIACRTDDRGADGQVAWVTFNNPEKRNALGVEGKTQFIELMKSLKHREELRAVVITGAGDESFVGGTNIAEMAAFDIATAEASATKTHHMCDVVRTFPLPVIARINGYCLGSGMELAACADMRVAADHAVFGMPETRLGIPSGMEASVLPKLIGWGKAAELVLTGDRIDAQEAHAIGYLQRLVPKDELDNATEGWLTSLLRCGPNAIRLQKRLLIAWDRMGTTDGARAGIEAYVDAYRTDEPRRLMTDFLARSRQPGSQRNSQKRSSPRT